MTQRQTTWRRRRWMGALPTSRGFPVIVLLFLLPGCGEEPRISQYEVSRESEPLDFRRLGVIIPFKEKVWYFKVDGPAKTLANEENHFEQFVQSIRFADKADPVTWKLPEGWRQEPGDGKFRYATIRLGPPEKGLELTVIPLDRDTDDWLLKNVNRWRDQVSLAPIRESELPATTTRRTIDGKEVTQVDLLGRKPRPKNAPFAKGKTRPRPKPRPDADDDDLSYQTPNDWRQMPRKGIRLASFVVGDGDKLAEITVIPAGGDLLGNVDRWRKELDMAPTTEERLKQEAKEIKVGGKDGFYVDLHGAGPKRILGVIVPRPGQSLFIKMTGPADLVGQQKRNFESFIRSVRFGDDAGK